MARLSLLTLDNSVASRDFATAGPQRFEYYRLQIERKPDPLVRLLQQVGPSRQPIPVAAGGRLA
jgi:hypothetical protein